MPQYTKQEPAKKYGGVELTTKTPPKPPLKAVQRDLLKIQVYFTCFPKGMKPKLIKWGNNIGYDVKGGDRVNLTYLIVGPEYVPDKKGHRKVGRSVKRATKIVHVKSFESEAELRAFLENLEASYDN